MVQPLDAASGRMTAPCVVCTSLYKFPNDILTTLPLSLTQSICNAKNLYWIGRKRMYKYRWRKDKSSPFDLGIWIKLVEGIEPQIRKAVFAKTLSYTRKEKRTNQFVPPNRREKDIERTMKEVTSPCLIALVPLTTSHILNKSTQACRLRDEANFAGGFAARCGSLEEIGRDALAASFTPSIGSDISKFVEKQNYSNYVPTRNEKRSQSTTSNEWRQNMLWGVFVHPSPWSSLLPLLLAYRCDVPEIVRVHSYF